MTSVFIEPYHITSHHDKCVHYLNMSYHDKYIKYLTMSHHDKYVKYRTVLNKTSIYIIERYQIMTSI